MFRYSLYSRYTKRIPYQLVDFANRLAKTKLRISGFINLDHYKGSSTPYQTNTVRIYSPTIFGMPGKTTFFEDAESKYVNTIKLNNIYLYTRSSLLINSTDNRVLLEYNYTKSKNLLFQDSCIHKVENDLVYYSVTTGNIMKVKKGISLLGKGSWNYFHMLLEYLPKLLFIDGDTSAYTLIVDHVYRDYDAFRFTISKIFNGAVMYVSEDDIVLVDELIYVTTPFYLTFNKQGPFDTSDIRYNYRIVEWISNLNKLLDEEIQKTKVGVKVYEKIFLTRNNKIRAYNSEGIETIAQKRGYQIIDLAGLSFIEQYLIMQSTQFFIGPTGASLTNLIFCKENTIGLTWMHNEWGDFPAYSTLAGLCKVELFYLQVISSGNDYHGAYYLDEELFARTIDEIELKYLCGNGSN